MDEATSGGDAKVNRWRCRLKSGLFLSQNGPPHFFIELRRKRISVGLSVARLQIHFGEMAMEFSNFMPTGEIASIFRQEVGHLGGRVSDCFDDGHRLIARAVLPGVSEVRPRDGIQGGVAMMAMGWEMRVHPYTFRQVCTNGAIMAQAIETRRIEVPAAQEDVEPATEALREAVRACCSREAFAAGVSWMRSAAEQGMDMALSLLPLLTTMGPLMGEQAIKMIVDRFYNGLDQSSFGLMNAVTSVARDTQDPEARWKLEELGGGIPALARRPVHRPGAAARMEMVPA
jgi:hypothetical protein